MKSYIRTLIRFETSVIGGLIILQIRMCQKSDYLNS